MGARTFLTRLLKGDDGLRALQIRRAKRFRALPDRKCLAEVYIPALAGEGGRILWVGCRAYTAEDYGHLEADGAEVWTTDIDPEAERWGRPGRYRTGDICEIDDVFPDMIFDAIVCNGVLGFGVDAPAQQRRAFQAMAHVLRPDGRLLLGWNRGRIDDPLLAGLCEPWFRPVPFAGEEPRVTFADTTHVYNSFARRLIDA